MELNEKDLKRIYQNTLKKTSARGKDCLEDEALFQAVKDELSQEEKFKIVDHVFECGFCAQRFSAIRDFYNEAEFLTEGKENIRLEKSQVKELIKTGKDKTKPQNKEKIILFSRLPLRYLSTAAALLFIVVGGILVLGPGKGGVPEDTTVRGEKQSVVELISPIGEVTKADLVFKWNSVENAVTYQIKAYNEELTAIWTSHELSNESQKPTPELLQKLKTGQRYFWKVLVYLKNNEIIKSDLKSFRIIPDTK